MMLSVSCEVTITYVCSTPNFEHYIWRTLCRNVTQSEHRNEEYYGAVFQPDAVAVGRNIPAIGPEQSLTLMPSYLSYRMRTIGGGTAEIQRNIVAKTVLRL